MIEPEGRFSAWLEVAKGLGIMLFCPVLLLIRRDINLVGLVFGVMMTLFGGFLTVLSVKLLLRGHSQYVLSPGARALVILNRGQEVERVPFSDLTGVHMWRDIRSGYKGQTRLVFFVASLRYTSPDTSPDTLSLPLGESQDEAQMRALAHRVATLTGAPMQEHNETQQGVMGGDVQDHSQPLRARLQRAGAPALPSIPRRIRFERGPSAALLHVEPLGWTMLFQLAIPAALISTIAGFLLSVWASMSAYGVLRSVYMGVGALWIIGSLIGMYTARLWMDRHAQVGFQVHIDGAGVRYIQDRPQGRGPSPVEGFWPHHKVTDVVVRKDDRLSLSTLGLLADGQYVVFAVGLTRAEADAAQSLISRAISLV
jgi:hypothetical protein